MSGATPTIAEAARLIAKKELSPVELTRTCLDRVHRLDNRLHAFIRLTEERALSEARAAEAAIFANGPKGPLHGIPIGLKDIVDTKGVATTCQSRLLADNVPDAFLLLYTFEAACMIQVRAQAGCGDLISIDPHIIATAQRQAETVTAAEGGSLAWPALLRKLDRIDPSYRN